MTESSHHGDRGVTGVKVATYNPLTKETHTEHKSYKSETYLPHSQTTIKTKEKSTRPELSDSETRVLP
jgi:hypothetical protein